MGFNILKSFVNILSHLILFFINGSFDDFFKLLFEIDTSLEHIIIKAIF